eukprot:TRINITY_DN14640_c0_g1_i1.p1 TRINITY_DN14640_c0_g1~~TRINITY_DN14640_c0_g1_i1.p1  ORF type:complete len:168 (-),score=40.79 TRINITY_DN14640_c0_g1_i1:316-819(-)
MADNYEQHKDLPPVPDEQLEPPVTTTPSFEIPSFACSGPRLTGLIHLVLCLIAHSCMLAASKSNSSSANNIADWGIPVGNLISASMVLSSTSGILAISEVHTPLAGYMAALAIPCLVWTFVGTCHAIELYTHPNDTINTAAAFTSGCIITQIVLYVQLLPILKDGRE